MTDGILDERLQNQLRNQKAVRIRSDGPGNRESCAKPHLLEIEILPHELEFLSKSDEVRAAVLQSSAQQAGELDDHLLGALAVAFNQGRDPVQSIEEKVRVKLHLERMQLTGRQSLLKFVPL